jgi:flagellar biosynthesis/type III secretory pathway protein FliH
LSSQRSRGFLRAPRRGDEVALDIDGRQSVDALFSGMHGMDPAETGEAGSIVERAQQRAEALVREAALSAASIEQEAYVEGLTAGRRQGAIEAHLELLDALTLVQRVALEAKAMRDALYAAAEPEIVELVIATCEAVLGDRIATDADLVHQTVRRALERTGSQNVLRIRVAPEEQGPVIARLAEDHGDVQPFRVVGDRAVSAGGCLIDTDAGRVDARLDVQLAEMAALLRAALPAPGATEDFGNVA